MSELDFDSIQGELNAQFAHCPPVPEIHRAALQAQHRSALDAAVAQARAEEREKVDMRVADGANIAIQSIRAEYAPLLAAVREWLEARKAREVTEATLGSPTTWERIDAHTAAVARLRTAEQCLAAIPVEET